MTRSLKNKLIALFVGVFLITCTVFAVTIKNYNAKADIFTYTQDVSVTNEQSLSDTFLGGKKGFMFSAVKNGTTVSLTNGSAGLFNVEFTPYSSIVGEAEFTSFTFKFTSDNARIGFSLSFQSAENGVNMILSLSNRPLVTKEIKFDGSFSNTSDKAISFSFDPDLMRVYNSNGVVVADFKSVDFMMSFDMVTLIESYQTYSVEMYFGGIVQGKTAKVIIYELCGQKFDKAPIENSSAPIVYKDVTLPNGVIGKAYKVSQNVCTYDVKDGFNDIIAIENITVTDGLNNSVELTDGAFTPAQYGVYYANYTPVDRDGLKGKTYSYPFYIFESQPEIEFNFQYPLEDMQVGKGSEISFGTAIAKSELSSDAILVKATVKTNDNEVYSIADCSNGFKYTFNQKGDFIVEFSAVDNVGYAQSFSVLISVTDEAVFKNVSAIKDLYAKDTTVSFNSVFAMLGSDMFTTTAVVTFPDGRTNSSGVVTLDEEGVYKVDFTATVSGATINTHKYFTVKNDNVSLWSAQDGLTVTSNAKAPSYADEEYCGTMLTVTRPIEAVYENVIDISDNTADDMLIELFVAPTVIGTLETSCIDIILTDVYDTNKVVDIRLARDAWKWESMKSKISVIAQPKRDFDLNYLHDVCKHSGDYQQYYYYRQSIYSSLYGKIENSNENSASQSIKLYFDYQTGELYASLAVQGSAKGKIVVADLSNETYVGTGNAWKKFTTGEAKLSVKISGLTQTANVMILNIDGQNMAGAYTTDTTAPSIFIDYAGNSANKVPNGIVGMPYKIFSSYSIDIAEGKKFDVNVEVYRNNGGILYNVENNGSVFVPSSVGEYIIRYSAKDAAGNSKVVDVKVDVKNEQDIAPKNYQFNANLPSEVNIGTKFVYLKGKASGGSGVLTTSVRVVKDGANVELDENNSFIVNDDGEYQVAVKVKDYLGESQEFIHTFTAKLSPLPVIEKVTMPEAVIEGQEFTIPQFKAMLYTTDGSSLVDLEYYVNGEKLNSNKFVPQRDGSLVEDLTDKEFTSEHVGKVKLEIKYQGELIEEYELQVLTTQIYKVADGAISVDKKGDPVLVKNQFLQGYFNTNAKQKLLSRSATFTFSEPSYVSLIKPMSTDFLYFTFSSEEVKVDKNTTIAPGTNLSRIDFTLTDSVNPDIAFTVSVTKKDAEESVLEYNGSKYIIPGAGFDSYSKNFKVNFNKDTNELSFDGKVICTITHCDNGSKFYGFNSGAAYLKFTMPEVENDGVAAIGILNYGGQGFDMYVTNANGGPSIKILGSVNDVEKGEYLILPAATAYDYMKDITSITVSVTAPNGDVLLNNVDITQERSVLIETVGAYNVLYCAQNSVGYKNTETIRIEVLDRIPPTIKINGVVQEAAFLNSTVVLPRMTVTDDNSTQSEIKSMVYLRAPNGEFTLIENYTFKAECKGTYVVIYYACDGDNAIATKTFSILVR